MDTQREGERSTKTDTDEKERETTETCKEKGAHRYNHEDRAQKERHTDT